MPDAAQQRARIMLVDDHALFRESVARLLASEPGFNVVAHCESVEQALGALEKTQVDIVLLDFDLGQRDGGEFMRLVRQRGFRGKVLVVTAGVEKGTSCGSYTHRHLRDFHETQLGCITCRRNPGCARRESVV